jgi:hypothetical protein
VLVGGWWCWRWDYFCDSINIEEARFYELVNAARWKHIKKQIFNGCSTIFDKLLSA